MPIIVMKKIKNCLVILCLFNVINCYSQDKIQWLTIQKAFELNSSEPKKIMIDVFTDWCGWCKVMDSKTFDNPVVANYINNNYYAVKLNAEQRDSILLNGKSYNYVSYGSRGYNQLAIELLSGQMSFPSLVFLNEDKSMLQKIDGYIEAKQFDAIIRFLGEDIYKTKTWEEYQSGFISEIKE
jgi:thioredoxin-related protein